jgi:RNA polymerase primary sigma factor
VPRKTDQPFKCQPLGELTRQLLYAPPDKRVEQVRRAEALHDQIDPDKSYAYDHVASRITGYHAETDADLLLVGEAIRPDLRQLIDVLSHSVGVPVTDDEPVESPEGLARRLNVSTKTITRWRRHGLRWRWVVGPGGTRKRVAYTKAAIDHFLSRQRDRVEYAGQFTQIDPALRQKLIDRARRIAQARDVSLHQVARHLARRVGRAVETIRQMLDQYDHAHRDEPIFADRTGPLNAEQKRLIARAYRMGVPAAKLCRHFNRTRSSIHRAVRDQRAAALRRLAIRYHELSTFSRDDADEVILRAGQRGTADTAESTSGGGEAVSAAPVDDLPEPLRPLYRQAVMSDDRQRSLVVRMNYLRYKAARLRDGLDKYEPPVGDLASAEACLAQAKAVRDRLVAVCLPTVLSVARQHLVNLADRSPGRLIEHLEVGNRVAIEAIDAFDPSRDQTLQRYLVWLLNRRFASEFTGDEAGPAKTAAVAARQSARRARAHRREPGEAVLQRMQAEAKAAGVDLPVP